MPEHNAAFMLAFIRSHRWAVEASVSLAGAPQAAIIGVTVTDRLELVFDTLSTSRKALNLEANAHIAFVIGGWADADPRTLQYEGIAEFPDGRDRLSWPGLTHVRVKPTWLRFSDFTVDPPVITELHL